MELRKIGKLMFLIFVVVCGTSPVFSMNSASQSVNMEVPETNAISSGYGTGGSSVINLGYISPDDTETALNGLKVTGLSNDNAQLWVKAGGDFVGQKTSQKISVSNLKFDVAGSSEKTNFSEGYVRMMNGGNSDDDLALNLYLKVPYGTAPDTYTTTIYLTSVLDTLEPA